MVGSPVLRASLGCSSDHAVIKGGIRFARPCGLRGELGMPAGVGEV